MRDCCQYKLTNGQTVSSKGLFSSKKSLLMVHHPLQQVLLLVTRVVLIAGYDVIGGTISLWLEKQQTSRVGYYINLTIIVWVTYRRKVLL